MRKVLKKLTQALGKTATVGAISGALMMALSLKTFAQEKSVTHFPSEPIIASRDCVLQLIADQMKIKLDPSRAKPTIRPETTTTLKEFQDSIEGWWNFRPDVFVNVFNPLRNEIFIMTERAYYVKHERSVYDSLAHELAHYVQKEYQHADFTVGDDSLEGLAVEVQTWFRESFQSQFQGDEFLCPLNRAQMKSAMKTSDL